MTMLKPACLWNRTRLERYADGALGPRLTRSVKGHLDQCEDCLHLVEYQVQLGGLVKSALPEPADPDWAGFWPGIQAHIQRDEPKPMRDPWWVPLWKPFWGHPRLALGGVMVAVVAVALSLWPFQGPDGQAAWAGPVVVQDVGTSDPGRGVMVYSSPDQALTVIWLFPAEAGTEES
jgi:putative zinc finger protein